MEFVQENWLSLLSVLFLVLAIFSQWFDVGVKNYRVWLAFVIGAFVSLAFAGHMNIDHFFVMALIFWLLKNINNKDYVKEIQYIFLALAFGGLTYFAIHKVPGVNNWMMVDQINLSENSQPWTWYINFDKALVGLVLLLTVVKVTGLKSNWRLMLDKKLLALLLIAPLVLGLSWLLGLIEWAPKLPPYLLLWLITHLCFTVIVEEVVFRGWIQASLTKKLKRNKHAAIISLVAVSVLFGLAHFAGGWMYVVVATIAGLGYGAAYHFTKRLEFSITLHLLVNVLHITLFTYPLAV